MHILGIQIISSETLQYAYSRYLKILVVKLNYMHILGIQIISRKPLLNEYSRYPNH